MIINVHTFELSKVLTEFDYRLIKKWFYESGHIERGNVYPSNGSFYCKQFSPKGINLFLNKFADKNGFTHHRIRIVVNANNLINEKSRVELMPLTRENIEVVEKNFNEIFEKAPCGFREFDDFFLTRVDLTVDMLLEGECRKNLIELGNRSYIPPSWHRELFYDKVAKRKKVSDRGLRIESNSKAVILYDKGKQLENAGIKDLDSKDGVGILRAELALFREFIVSKQNKFEMTDDDQRTSPVIFLFHLEQEGASYILNSFQKVFRSGEYRKLDDALDLLDSCGHRENTKSGMRDFLYACAKRRSVEVAANEMKDCGMNQREIRGLLMLFDDLGVNPLTIPRRWSVASYPSIATYIENALKEM